MSHQFYVYLHCKPDGTPFYVGKGHGKRAGRLTACRNLRHARVVRKYGADAIGVFVFHCASEAEAFFDERAAIAQLRSEGFPLVNATDGGEGVTGLRHTSESKRKMADQKIGRPLSESHRAKLSIANRGKNKAVGRKHSAETRQKMSAAHLGRPKQACTDEHRRNLSLAHMGQQPWNKGLPSPNRGIPRSPETKAKLSKALSGKTLTAEHRLKLSAKKMGKPLSDEHRAKVSASLLAFHQSKRAQQAQGEKNGQ